MFFKAVLACALLAVVSAQSTTTTAPSTSSTTRKPSLFSGALQDAIGSLGNAAKAKVGLASTAAQTTTNLLNGGVQGFTSIGKSVVENVSSLKSSALQGGVDVFKQGVDFGTNLAGIIPVLGGFASFGGNLAKTGADVVNKFGQNAISAGKSIGTGKLDVISGATNAGAIMATNGITMGKNMANAGIDTGVGIAKSVADRLGSVADTAMNFATQASGNMASLPSIATGAYSATGASSAIGASTTTGASTSTGASSATGASTTTGGSSATSASKTTGLFSGIANPFNILMQTVI